MSKPPFLLDLSTGTTRREFLDAGAKVSGFRESRWRVVQSVRAGDFLLCYLTGLSRFIGPLGVTSQAYRDQSTTFPLMAKLDPLAGPPPVQYIVTTPTNPPEEMIGGEAAALRLQGTESREPLFPREL